MESVMSSGGGLWLPRGAPRSELLRGKREIKKCLNFAGLLMRQVCVYVTVVFSGYQIFLIWIEGLSGA